MEEESQKQELNSNQIIQPNNQQENMEKVTTEDNSEQNQPLRITSDINDNKQETQQQKQEENNEILTTEISPNLSNQQGPQDKENQEQQKDHINDNSEETKSEEINYNIIQSYKSYVEYDPIVWCAENKLIQIKVDNPVYHAGGIDNFVAYKIIGQDEEGSYSNYRRFSEFYEMREVLIANWPGFYIPPISPKKIISSNTSESINERLRFLTSFCKKIANCSCLYKSQEFQILVKAKSLNLAKQLEQIAKKSTIDFINQLTNNIPGINEFQLTNLIIQQIDQYKEKILKLQVYLKDLYKQLEKETQLQQSYHQQTKEFFRRVIVDYETLILNYCTNNKKNAMVIGKLEENEEHQKLESKMIKDFSINQLQYLQDSIFYDIQDTEAILRLIDSKAQYEKVQRDIQNDIQKYQKDISELQLGNTTLRSVFKFNQSKEQQIEESKNITQNLQQESKFLSTLIEKITSAIFIQITKLSIEKKQYYKQLILSISSQYKIQANTLLNMWTDYYQVSKQQAYDIVYN